MIIWNTVRQLPFEKLFIYTDRCIFTFSKIKSNFKRNFAFFTICFTDAKIQNFIKREKSYKFSLRLKFRPIFSIFNTKIDWIWRINVRHFSRFNNMPFPLFIYLFPPAYCAYMIFHCDCNDFFHDFIVLWDFVIEKLRHVFFRRENGRIMTYSPYFSNFFSPLQRAAHMYTGLMNI